MVPVVYAPRGRVETQSRSIRYGLCSDLRSSSISRDATQFVFVLRGGIKKLAAAKVITRSFRKAKRGRAAALGTSVLGVATSVTAEEAKTMTLIEVLHPPRRVHAHEYTSVHHACVC